MDSGELYWLEVAARNGILVMTTLILILLVNLGDQEIYFGINVKLHWIFSITMKYLFQK